jgi:hypothetical protein
MRRKVVMDVSQAAQFICNGLSRKIQIATPVPIIATIGLTPQIAAAEAYQVRLISTGLEPGESDVAARSSRFNGFSHLPSRLIRPTQDRLCRALRTLRERWNFALEGYDVDWLKSPSLRMVGCGRIPKWPTGADCKSAGSRLRWFESSSYHHSKTISTNEQTL